MSEGQTLVRNGRIIFQVPPAHLRPEAGRLKARLDVLLPPWCLDHCWTKGRTEEMAYEAIQPGWGFLDIVSFFTSIDQWRLFGLVPPELRQRLRTFFDRLGCYQGIPEGCAFSPTLANLYLGAIDKRWTGNSVRYGDNIACANPPRYAAELATINLAAKERPTFTNRVDQRPWVADE